MTTPAIETLVAQHKAWRRRAMQLRNALEEIIGYGEGSADPDLRWIVDRSQRAVDEGQVAEAAPADGVDSFEVLARELTIALDGMLGTESDDPDFEEKWDLAEATCDRAREALGMKKTSKERGHQ